MKPLIRYLRYTYVPPALLTRQVRLEKTTHLGDGTVVISRLGPPAVFGEFFFIMVSLVTDP